MRMIVYRAGRFVPDGEQVQLQDPQLLVTARLARVAQQNLGYFGLDPNLVLEELPDRDPVTQLVAERPSGVYLVGEPDEGGWQLWSYDPVTLRPVLLVVNTAGLTGR